MANYQMKNASDAAIVDGSKDDMVRVLPGQILKADSSNPSHVVWAQSGVIEPTGPKGEKWVEGLRKKAKPKSDGTMNDSAEQPEE